MRLRRVFAKAIVMLAATMAAAAAWAGYPERPIRVIIPFAPGGGTDVVGRLVAERLGHATGHTFIAENKPGANAAIGANFVAKAPADGYTVLFGIGGTFVIGIGSLAIGLVLMFLWFLFPRSKRFFRGESLNRDTEVMVPDEPGATIRSVDGGI